MRASFLFGSLAALSVIDSAWAEPDAAGLDSVVVTATRSEQSLNKVGDSITVLTADEVRERQKTTVSDLVSSTPGVTMARNGGYGGTTSLFIRGAETDQTVVLIDGVKLNDPSSPGGGYNFADLLTDDVSRIEVLRGPQSTLWGSQAIGGVVNLITSKPEGPVQSRVSLEGGSRSTGQVRARVEAGDERVAWRIAGNYFRTDGVSAFDKNLGGREDDGYKNTNLSARAYVKVTDAVSLDLRSAYWHARNDFDGFPPPLYSFTDTPEYGETDEWVAYGGVNIAALEGKLRNRIGYAYTDTDRSNYDPTLSVRKTFDASGRNGRIEYQGTLALAEGYQTVFGVESEHSQMSSASPSEFDPSPLPLRKDVTLNSGYAQLQAAPLTSLTVTAGVRYDDHDTFGSKTIGRGAVAWRVAPQTLLRASYGQGFKAPTLYQLFSEYGNAQLQPESAHGWDAGIEQHLLSDTLALSATYFNRDTTNLIAFVSCFGSADPRCVAQPFGFYDNIQRSQADGVELGATFKANESLQIAANYTRTNAVNNQRGSANFDKDLPRRPRNAANANLDYKWPFGLTTGVSVQYVGKSYDNVGNTFALDSYTLVDLRASDFVTDRIEVYGRLENAFDEKYETTRNYGSIGRGVFLGARLSF